MTQAATTWVLLRGLARESRHWDDFPAHLQQHFPRSRILMPDLPGNGRRCDERSPGTVAGMVDAYRATIGAAIAQEAQAPLGLIGLSLGGMVAAQWAVSHADEVSAVVMINSSARPYSRMWQRLRPNVWPWALRLLGSTSVRAREHAALCMTSRLRRNDDALLERWTTWAHECPMTRVNRLRQLSAAIRFHLPPTPPAAPVLVLTSAADDMVAPACSQAIARAWRAPIERHPAAGHDLTLDDGRWAAGRIRAWCDGAIA